MSRSLQLLNILVIEDEPADFAIIASLLKDHHDGGRPPTLLPVACLEEALQALRERGFDAVLCDLNLPDSSGLDTVKKIREITSDPIVILTGSNEHELAEQAIRLGAQDYLEKDSLTSGRLWRCLRFACERNALATEWEEIRKDRERSRRQEAISRFSGGLAHDVNNALAIMLGYTETLREDGAKALEESVPLIKDAGDRIARLIHRLTQVGAREEGAHLETLDLGRMIEGLHIHLEREVPRRLTLSVALDRYCYAETCAAHLHQILEQLLRNAVEAMSGQGKISLACFREGDEVVLQVSDTGPGIQQDVLEHVLDPYYTTKKEAHSGLGLSLAAGIMKSSGGHIYIASNTDGTTVRCHFPAKEAPLPAGPPLDTKTVVTSERKPKILVADDEDMLRRLLEVQLGRIGCEVVCAADGVEAMERFTENPASYDLLISDVLMPRMKGPELAKKVREKRPDLPVLMITAYSAGLLKKEPWYTPDLPLLTKPFDWVALREMVLALVHD